ncbi:MAG TPA: hypothetical protein PLL99_07325 [Chitinophagales bacterium]|nr:hypothetical protein [Chitinophagales bacterium]
MDKLFYRSNNTIQLSLLEYALPSNDFLDGNGDWLSDHRPLYGKFQFNVLN